MSRWSPCKRSDFIRRLRGLGFEGPFSGGKHHFMVFRQGRLAIPSNDEYSVPQLKMMIREVGVLLGRTISLQDWNRLA
jgi:predicted RNA binding protein YcfA (HicA-like mRNA interferase family)